MADSMGKVLAPMKIIGTFHSTSALLLLGTSLELEKLRLQKL